MLDRLNDVLFQGTAEARIVLDSSQPAVAVPEPALRLVDGLSPLSGRLQMFHLGHWRSVCTNSRK